MNDIDTADDDLELEIIDDTPEDDRGHKPPETKESKAATDADDEELASYSEGVQKRIKKLKWEFHEERRAKEAAAREHAEAIKYAKHVAEQNRILQEQLSQGERALITQAKARVEAEQEKAKRTYREAYEAGDPDRLVEAQEAVTRATMERQQIDSWTPRQVQPVVVPQPQQQSPQADPKAVRWGAKNPWFGSDEEMTSLAYGIHEKLVKSGVDPTTDEYFSKLDDGMRRRFPEYFGEGEVRQSSPPKPASVVAPAGRSTKQPRKVTLTATQVSLAKRLGITPEQYAAQIVKEMGQ